MLFVLCPLSGAGASPILPLPGWLQWFLSLPGPRDRSSAGSSHRQTHWWCHITQVWGFPPVSTERLCFWTQLMKPWAGQERPHLQKVRDDKTSSFIAFLLQFFSWIPLIHLSNTYRYWQKCLLTQRFFRNLLIAWSPAVFNTCFIKTT